METQRKMSEKKDGKNCCIKLELVSFASIRLSKIIKNILNAFVV